MKDYDVWKANCDTKAWNLERIGPHGITPASAAFENIAREEAQKGISVADRSAAQAIEDEIGSISDTLLKLLTPSLWDQRMEKIRLNRDAEERMALTTVFERDRAAIPQIRAQFELDHTMLVKKLVPFAIKVLKLVIRRLPTEIESADVSTQQTCAFFKISAAGSSDWLVYPLQRLLQGLMSQLHFLEIGEEDQLMYVRQLLADAGVIKCRV